MRPGMGVIEAEKGRDRVAEERPAQVADEEHPQAAMLVGAARSLVPAMNQSTKLFSLSKYFMSSTRQLIGRRQI